ncbi:hypothetical protein AALB53_16350 [Lachnospiraceae bacterium 47-T17]
MLNIALTHKGIVAVPGIPEYYFEDSDLVRFLKDQNMIKEFIRKYGDNVTVGRLGKRNRDGVYCENEQVVDIDDITDNGDLGYYAQL